MDVYVCVWYSPPASRRAGVQNAMPGPQWITTVGCPYTGRELRCGLGTTSPYMGRPARDGAQRLSARLRRALGTPVQEPNMDEGSGKFLRNTSTFLMVVRGGKKVDGVGYIRIPVVVVTLQLEPTPVNLGTDLQKQQQVSVAE